ncbi:MAG: LysE family transporter [Lutibacter sp.]|jgi:threonine/homoserine/homoserine lactone efflux protein|nr:LysE family transporter [Lutibacter sp.]
MSLAETKDAVLIGLFLSFMIGPVFFMLIQTSITRGIRAAISFNAGVVLADIVFILIAYYGSRPLLERIKDDPRMFYLGGLILLIYGLVVFLNKDPQRTVQGNPLGLSEKVKYTQRFFQGFLLNFINVGVLAFWLGMIVVIGPNLAMEPGKVAAYFGVILAAYFVIDIGKIALAKQLKKKLTPSRTSRIKRGMGLLLMVFGMALILKGFFPEQTLGLKQVIDQAAL